MKNRAPASGAHILDCFEQTRCYWRRVTPEKSSLGAGFILAGMLFSSASAQAQEALYSALGLDSALAQHNASNNSPGSLPQSHLGPVDFTLGASAGVEENDNINLTETGAQSDTIIRAGLTLGLVWPATEQSELSFNAAADYAKYLAHPSDDQFEISPGSVLTWKISFEDGSLMFFDQFSESQSVISEASVSGVNNIPRIDNTIGARLEWQPGRWLFELDCSYDNYFSDGAAYEYLNRDSEYLLIRAGHRVAEDTQLGLEVSASFTKYELALQSNNTSYSVGPYLEWQLTHFINISVRGGYTIFAFDSNGEGQSAQNLGSYYASLELTHQLTQFISQRLSVERDISLGLNQGNNYTEQLTAGYTINWEATAHLGLHLSLTYENGNQPLTSEIGTSSGILLSSQTENYSRVGISPGISYQFTRKLAGSLTGAHWERMSNLNDGYQDNSVSVQLNYTF